MISKIHIQIGGDPMVSHELWWDDAAVTIALLFVIGFSIISVPCAYQVPWSLQQQQHANKILQ